MWAKKQTGINRIFLSRPVVEAGEKIGFLPGMIQDKLDPYMRPYYDCLHDMVGAEAYQDKLHKGFIEIAPLAFMRGRNLQNCFVILDEAQNATFEQITMLLTRLCDNVKLVVCGDPYQSDINGKSGLCRMVDAMTGVPDIGITRFEKRDVVRSEIVRNVLEALDRFED